VVELFDRDVVRAAQMVGTPYASLHPDPIAMNVGTHEVCKAQPLSIDRLGRASPPADRGNGLALLKEVSAALFRGHRPLAPGRSLASSRGACRSRTSRARPRYRGRPSHYCWQKTAQSVLVIGCAADGIRERTVPRSRPVRSAKMAHGTEAPEAAGLRSHRNPPNRAQLAGSVAGRTASRRGAPRGRAANPGRCKQREAVATSSHDDRRRP
jgi:hypothetical protein